MAAGRREAVHPVQQTDRPIGGAEKHDTRVQFGRVLPALQEIERDVWVKMTFLALLTCPVPVN